MIKKIILALLFLVLLESSFAALPVSLSDQGTGVVVKATGNRLFNGSLQVEIFDALSGGNLVYNETFSNAIQNGTWGVMLGENASNNLTLEFGKVYYKDYKLNGTDIDFLDYSGNTVERQFFYSPLGEIGGEDINETWINATIDSREGVLNVNTSNQTTYWDSETSQADLNVNYSTTSNSSVYLNGTAEYDLNVNTSNQTTYWAGISAITDLYNKITLQLSNITINTNLDMNQKNITNVNWLNVTGNLNVLGTSYLGDIIISADNVTTNNILPKDNNDIVVHGTLNVTENITADRIGARNGSSALPAFFFSEDVDTGLFRRTDVPGIAFVIDGNEKARVQSTGAFDVQSLTMGSVTVLSRNGGTGDVTLTTNAGDLYLNRPKTGINMTADASHTLTVEGIVNATSYIGDGSALTGITGTSIGNCTGSHCRPKTLNVTDYTSLNNHTDIYGELDIVHTASEADDHAVEIDVDAAGYGDVKGFEVFYDTGAIDIGEDEEAILVVIDDFSSIGGSVAGYEVLATEGGAEVHGMLAGATIHPILQLSGTFGDMDTALVKTVDRLTEFTSTASDIAIFVADDDTVVIGDANHFEEIEVILDTTASASIKPEFRFSTGVGTWTEFSPVDGTNGFRNNGIIAWEQSDVPTWAVGAGGEYLINITRTRNNLVTNPIEDIIQISSVTEYEWDKDGNLTIQNINATNKITSKEIISDDLYVADDSNFSDDVNVGGVLDVEGVIDTKGGMDVSNLTGTWKTYTPTFTGFDPSPSGAGVWAKYIVVGKMVTLRFWGPSSTGTSNAVTFTMSLPIAGITHAGYSQGGCDLVVVDNGAWQTTPGSWVITSGATSVTFGKACDNLAAGGGFTASSTKYVYGVITYEAA